LIQLLEFQKQGVRLPIIHLLNAFTNLRRELQHYSHTAVNHRE